MKNRRNFLKKALAGVLAAGIFPITKKASAGEVKLKGALTHHVYFWLKEPDNDAHRQQFEKAINKLLKVETIKLSHFGVPARTEKREVVDNSYTYSYMVMFDSIADQDKYQVHPIHLEFVEKNSDLWDKVIVYDSVDELLKK
ncbi:MAG TPA: Dabb family protein [Prolixibacteraceae bacterium]|nr:Dabb family protein [Prolixibacteraceae bacterium]